MKNKSVLIIAEAGVNHNGCLEKAKKLVDVAAEAGADIVKFQLPPMQKKPIIRRKILIVLKHNMN